MARKLFTFLGAGRYSNIIYYKSEADLNDSEYTKVKSQYVQVSLSRLLGDDIKVITFLTKKARENNWSDSQEKDGLNKQLDELNIPYESRNIKDGSTEEELWDNFNTFYEACDEGDEIYLDITYSFRSIPIILMSVLNYAATTKNIKLKGIYYGAFEAKRKDEINEEEIEVAPIFDLNLFYEIQGWAKAVEQFIKTGDSRELSNKIKETENDILENELDEINKEYAKVIGNVAESLNKYSEDLVTCRGRNIIDDTSELKENLKAIVNSDNINLKQFLPLIKIISKIYENIKAYGTDSIDKDFLYAVKQCDSFNLIQQGYTILQELLTTYVVNRLNQDYKSRNKRNTIESKINKIKKVLNDQSQLMIECKYFIDRGISLDVIKSIALLHKEIADFRNDLNHGGFAKENNTYEDFKNNLNKSVEKFENIINNDIQLPIAPVNKNVVIILSHNLTEEQKSDLEVNWNVEGFIDLPEILKEQWKNINPEDEELNNDIIRQLVKFIEDNTEEEDYILIQGEYGMTFLMANKCLDLNRIPIYATTKRISIEKNIDGEIHLEKVFKHIRFRKYMIKNY